MRYYQNSTLSIRMYVYREVYVCHLPTSATLAQMKNPNFRKKKLIDIILKRLILFLNCKKNIQFYVYCQIQPPLDTDLHTITFITQYRQDRFEESANLLNSRKHQRSFEVAFARVGCLKKNYILLYTNLPFYQNGCKHAGKRIMSSNW